MEKEHHVPGWDGQAKGWRRYTREVCWYVRATPQNKRRHCASKLMSRLTGPARLLAMSWPDVDFDRVGGTKEYLRRLAVSPLVRQSLPNAAAICQQYFSFKRAPGEPIHAFLVREALGYSEFVEAIIRLYEDKHGIKQDDKDFGLPSDELEDEWTQGEWDDWWRTSSPLHQKFPKFLLKIHHKLHLRQPLLRLKLLLQSRLHLLVTWALLLAEHLRASLEECLHWFLRNDLSEFHQLLLTL